GSITTHPASRSSRTKPSGRTPTPVSFLLPVELNPMWPVLLTIMEIDPDIPMRGSSSSRTVSPVISHHLQISLRAGCPAAGNFAHRGGSPFRARWVRGDAGPGRLRHRRGAGPSAYLASARISVASATHSVQIHTPGPATRRTSPAGSLPQNEH